jgi:MFS family permease
MTRASARLIETQTAQLLPENGYFRGSGSAAALRRGHLTVVAATIAMAMGFGGLGLITVLMPSIEADLGWTRSDTSLGYAASTAGIAIGGAVWGRLSDRLDLRALLAIGGACMIASLFALSAVHSLAVFYLANAIYGGFGFSAVYSLLISTSSEWFPRRRGAVVGLVTAGGALGQGIVPLLASMLNDAMGWRLAYAGIGCMALIVHSFALPWLRWPGGTKAVGAHSVGRLTVQRSINANVLLLCLAAFFCCMCMGIPLVHMASFIGMVCGSPSLGVNSLATAMIAGAVGRVCFGLIADRTGPLKAYALASFLQSLCVVLFPLFGSSMSFLALSAVFGFGFAGNMTCFTLCVRQAVPAHKFGGAIGMVMMVAWAGMASGGYLGAVLYDAFASYTFSFILAGVAGALNLMILAVLGVTYADRAYEDKRK